MGAIMKRAILFLTLSSQFLAGCAEMTHLTRTRELGQTGYVLIDAKQRAISARGGVSCAEPSPDALSAIAASQSLNFTTPSGVSAANSFALAESAASIGLRTQSIQLMRDHMFRVCEAHQSGQITPFMVALLHRRFQTTMVAILAIEQLTGTMRAPAVVLGGSASSGNADAVVKLTAQRETQAAQVETAAKDLEAKAAAEQTAIADRDAKLAALTSATDKPAAQAALDAAEAKAKAATADKLSADGTLAGRKAALAAVDRAITLAQASGSASATGTIEAISHHPGDVAAVAGAVSKIVEQAFGLGNSKDFCTVLLADAATTGSRVDPASSVVKSCLGFLSTGNMLYIQ